MSETAINLRELQAPLKERYRQHPEEANITLRVNSTPPDLSDPLHCSVAPESVPGLEWPSGAHPGVGGTGDVACSGDYLLGALAACQEVTLRMVASAMGIELKSLSIDVSGDLDLRGTLGLDPEAPVGFKAIRCDTRVSVEDDGRPDRTERLLKNAERYCVVLNTLKAAVPTESNFYLER